MTSSQSYSTKDLYMASLLYAKRIPLLKLDWVGSSCFFVFDDEDRCQQIMNQYRQHQLKVEAELFISAIRTLKDMIFSQR